MDIRRKLIDRNESRVSVVQLIGFALLLAGVFYFLGIMVNWFDSTGDKIAIDFFITMLGVAFAFPSLLQDRSKGLSTMRIVVFMMTNVICILLLKIGWGAHDLTAIGLNQYWVGVIAFTFGAKATQSFFESRMATNTQAPARQQLDRGALCRLAIQQNEQVLKAQFLNIVSISDAVDNLQSDDSHVVAIYIKDNVTTGLPASLTARLPDGTTQDVRTEIVSAVGAATIQISQGADNVSDSGSPNFFGSICCILKSTTNANFTGLLTSGHIYSNGYLVDKRGELAPADQGSALLDQNAAGVWFLETINNQQDLAVIQLTNPPAPDVNYISFAVGYYPVQDTDVKTPAPNITVVSKDNKVRDAYIVDYNIGLSLQYHTVSNFVQGIILIGSQPNRDTSTTVSAGGDSGSAVYHKASGKLIGMLLGGNDKFSFVLAVDGTLGQFNLKPL
jgi:hypothetical protein